MTSKAKRLGTGLEDRVVKKAQEKGIAAKKQPGSGIYNDHPSDCVIAGILTECKVRTVEIDAQGHRTFRVDLDWWDRVQKAAQKFSFDQVALVMNAKGSQKPLALIDLDYFLELVKKSQQSG